MKTIIGHLTDEEKVIHLEMTECAEHAKRVMSKLKSIKSLLFAKIMLRIEHDVFGGIGIDPETGDIYGVKLKEGEDNE